MYFSALRKSLQALEEKRFYDVALMYLEQIGYRELSIVDGSGDGGRDVVSSRNDLRIQLSVRKDWANKINDEAERTASLKARHLIFVTNRPISPAAEQDFLADDFKQGGVVDVSIHDLNRISTALARPGVIRRSYEMLGMSIPADIQATPGEIAISSLLMFSDEARELRQEMIEASVRADIYKHPSTTEAELVHRVSASLPGGNQPIVNERTITSAVSRLRIAKRITMKGQALDLSPEERQLMVASEVEFAGARETDASMLAPITGLTSDQNKELIDLAANLVIQSRDLMSGGPAEEALRAFLAGHGLTPKRQKIYEALSKGSLAKLRQFGSTVNELFETNTFDIFRALGRRTDLTMVLDASVAMPLLFGLAFRPAKSRYGVAAQALKEAADAHGIKMIVPRCYLNEMAAHGALALEFSDIYNQLPEAAVEPLRSSQNAYLSHFTHIKRETETGGDDLSLGEFLGYFGITKGRSISQIENKIQSVLDTFGIRIEPDRRYQQALRNLIVERKTKEPRLVVDHDAIVLTMLKDDDDKGFILVTWDKVMIDLVEDLARVFADTPARTIDFLAMATGSNFETDTNYEALSALLHADERKAEKLAQAIEKIRTVDQVYKLDRLVSAARAQAPSGWQLRPGDVESILDPADSGVVAE